MKRRHLLVLLGLGGATAGGYYYGTDEEDTSAQLKPLATPNPEETLSAVDTDAIKTRVPTQPFSFVSESISESVEGAEQISHVTAEPAKDVAGDRIRLQIRDETEIENFANELRLALNVGESVKVQHETEDRVIDFVGGSTGEQAALVGTIPQLKAVLIARSGSIASVKQVATNWEL